MGACLSVSVFDVGFLGMASVCMHDVQTRSAGIMHMAS